jgi:hypothetical protein
MIESADDCRLVSHDGTKIHTYCGDCFERISKEKLTKEPDKIIIQ